MSVQGVLVSFKMEDNEETVETSGILFDNNKVLISGTSLIPVLFRKEWILDFVKCSSSKLALNKYTQKILYKVIKESKEKNDSNQCLNVLIGKAVSVWKCPLVSESLMKMFNGWAFQHQNSHKEVLSHHEINLCKELMSIIIVLQCGNEEGLKVLDSIIDGMKRLMLNLEKPRKGQKIQVISTPFGNTLFLNSCSTGIISNIVGHKNCIILCDARTVSGCEGGPIFVTQRSSKNRNKDLSLVGFITCPLTSWRGEWVGLSIGVSLLPVLERLLQTTKNGISYMKHNENIENCSISANLLPANFVDDVVVMIQCKNSWGSGVVLNGVSGLIITCSHVVKNEKNVSVFQKGNACNGEVVFRTQDDLAYDLAVIKVYNYNFGRGVILSQNSAKLGDVVIAVGFPFFCEKDDNNILPSIVTGCVSRVNPFMLQTTCCIQSGFSGGALLRNRELLGIIASNAKLSNSGALFPHINFIIPSSVFKEPILKYKKTNDVNVLKELECKDIKVQSLWKLHSSKL